MEVDAEQADADYVDDNTTCLICLESYSDGQEVTMMTCGHRFHGNCLQLWITAATSDPTCPSCRGEMNIRSTETWRTDPAEAAGVPLSADAGEDAAEGAGEQQDEQDADLDDDGEESGGSDPEW